MYIVIGKPVGKMSLGKFHRRWQRSIKICIEFRSNEMRGLRELVIKSKRRKQLARLRYR